MSFVERDGERHRQYLGDAVYASFDGYAIWLRTGDGNNNEIALDPSVFDALVEYVEMLKRAYSETPQADAREASQED